MAKAVSNKQGKGRSAKGGAKLSEKRARASDGKISRAAKARTQARTQTRSSGREKRSLRKFMREVRVELGKVNWPSRSDLMQSTLVVLVAVLIAAVYVAGLDAVFSEVVDQILNLIT